MSTKDPALTVYRVTWHFADNPAQKWVGEVQVWEGYSTVEDIPNILAIRYANDDVTVVVDRAIPLP